MTDTANLGLPLIEGSQAQKHVTHNEALRILDAAIQIGVLDTTLTAPPSSPLEGERHVVASGATGAWSGQANKIATYEDATWRFLAPKLGWCVWSAADEVIFVYDGEEWRDLRDLPVGLDTVTHLGINATASSLNLLSVKSNAALFDAIAVADGGSGDARVQISKESAAHTASVVFSDAFSGRAEFGLVGSDAFKLKVSHDGSSFVEAFTIDQTTGNLTLPRGMLLNGVIAPSPITSNQNDYAPTGFSSASVLRISTDASRDITGLAGGAEGRKIVIINTGSNPTVLKDESVGSTSANRFGFGSDMTLAAKQGATLIYDGHASRWRQIGGPSASSSTGGATDSERQNALLTAMYQSKSLAEYRRLVNLFASGFKGASDALNGIWGASSSSYTVAPMSGNVAPSTAAGTVNTSGTPGSTQSFGPAYTYVNRALAVSNSVTIHSIGVYLTTPETVTMKIIQRDSATQDDIVVSQTLVHGGTGYEDVVLASPFAVPGSGTYYVAVYFSGSATRPAIASSARSYHAGDPAVQNDLTGWTDDTAGVPAVRWTQPGTTSNMVLVSVPQTADAAVSHARVLLEYDNAASPVLNTDVTAEVACKLNTATVTVTIASPGVVSHAAHGLSANDPVCFTTSGALPTGLVASTVYFVKTVVDANSYTLSTTPGGTVIATTGSQSGTHTAS